MMYKRKEITNHREIERIVYIHEQIAAGKYPNTTKLAEISNAAPQPLAVTLSF